MRRLHTKPRTEFASRASAHPKKPSPTTDCSPGKASQTWWWAESKNQVGAGDFTLGHQH